MVHPHDETTSNYKIENLQDVEPFGVLQRELSAGLEMYWFAAGHILEDSGITLLEPAEGFFSIAKNFFSANYKTYVGCLHIKSGISQNNIILFEIIDNT